MSDCSPLRLAENGNSSPSQSLGSRNSQTHRGGDGRATRGSNDRNGEPFYQQQQQQQQHQDHPNNHTGSRRVRSQSESSKKSDQIGYGAKNVIELFIPVSICMAMVVGIMKATDSYHYSSQSVIWYAQMMFTDQSVDTGTRVWQSFANAFIMLLLIVVMTTVLIVLYKLRCYKTIHGWLIISSLMLLFLFTTFHITEVLKVYNIPLDIFTLGIFLWNFGVVGMVSIHWKGPLLLQQAYLITISAFMALIFIQCLPDWTIWTVLAIVSVWDLVAVLAPRGPLRILVETAQERNESIFPALIYSSTMLWEVIGATVVSVIPTISMADVNNTRSKSNRNNRRNERQATNEPLQPNTSSSGHRNRHRTSGPSTKREHHPVEIHYDDGAQPPEVAIIQPSLSGTSEVGDNWQRPNVRAVSDSSNTGERRVVDQDGYHQEPNNLAPQEIRMEQMEEERGVKLGLGDFIFYSVLVGKASSYGDWNVTLSCYVAILVGLSVTLSLLAVLRKALPALPISIAFGMCSFFLSSIFVVPFADKLALNQIFI